MKKYVVITLLTATLAAGAFAGVASPAFAMGTGASDDNTYHGHSAEDANSFVNALTFYDNTHTNTVCAQVRTYSTPYYAGTKKCGTGTVNINNGTSYYNQSGGIHWGGSANSNPFYS